MQGESKNMRRNAMASKIRKLSHDIAEDPERINNHPGMKPRVRRKAQKRQEERNKVAKAVKNMVEQIQAAKSKEKEVDNGRFSRAKRRREGRKSSV
jgi:superfamily I DNA and/or RNA helicase